MKYADFEHLMSPQRMSRYLASCRNDTKKAMTLYRANLRLSQEVFSVLSVFEVILRNKIDQHYKAVYKPIIGKDDWLLFAVLPGGFYASNKTVKTQQSISNAISDLGSSYTHDKLIAELSFGFWRFQFGSREFSAAGSSLHQIFTSRPHGTNHTIIFNRLKQINYLRNRIAHHEPICFDSMGNSISTTYITHHLKEIEDLLKWMNVRSKDLFYGIDGIQKEVNSIDRISATIIP
jgi:hypothetical protein